MYSTDVTFRFSFLYQAISCGPTPNPNPKHPATNISTTKTCLWLENATGEWSQLPKNQSILYQSNWIGNEATDLDGPSCQVVPRAHAVQRRQLLQ